MLPILISVAVTPGVSSATAGAAAVSAKRTVANNDLFTSISLSCRPALTLKEALSRTTIPLKYTDNPLILSIARKPSAAAAVSGRSAASDA